MSTSCEGGASLHDAGLVGLGNLLGLYLGRGVATLTFAPAFHEPRKIGLPTPVRLSEVISLNRTKPRYKENIAGARPRHILSLAFSKWGKNGITWQTGIPHCTG